VGLFQKQQMVVVEKNGFSFSDICCKEGRILV
jgi:hypothetical protein